MVGVWYQFIISIEDSSKRDLFQFDNKIFLDEFMTLANQE